MSARIAIPAGFFVLASVGLLSFILIRSQREQVLAEVVHGSETLAQALLLSVDRDMRVNRREGVREVIETVGRDPGIEVIRVYNKDGRITYSSRPEEVGRTVDMGAESCVQCHSASSPPPSDLASDDRSRVYTNGHGRLLLATIAVIRNRPDCQGSGCHQPVARQSVLGVLDVVVSLDAASARLADATRDAVLISLAAALFITATLFFIIHRSVRQPLRLMVEATRRAAAGKGSLPVPPGSAREIGILAGSLNEMIESFASSRHRLEEWAGTLEQRVAAAAEELRQARGQVVQAERLSSVGVVAAGIAHELNSPLMAIITFASLVRASLPPEGQVQDDLRTIEREAHRCAAIIRQLLDFSRAQAQDPETRPCRLGPVLEEALELLKVEVQNSGVEVSLSGTDDLPPVEANEVQLMQVVVNLMLNAVQAMPEGGELTVRADVVPRRAYPHVEIPRGAERLVRIRVADTGTGIRPEDFSRIFDPFYTTKPVGMGSGLGLSVSLGIVQGYGGTILVDSDGESWTEFTVLLPSSEAPVGAASR